MEMSGELHAPVTLPPGETTLSTICVGGLGGPHCWSARYGEAKNLLLLPGIESRLLGHPSHSLVAIPTELSGLWSGDMMSNYLAKI
jgi:hypothetical protein